MKETINYLVNDILENIAVDVSLRKHLTNSFSCKGKLLVISIGKAAWQMGKTASDILKDSIYKGIVITKYGHSKGEIDNFEILEAGHPLLDENSLMATNKVLAITENLSFEDHVVFLISGGTSALLEKPTIELAKLQEVNDILLKSGANIQQINTIRKRLSLVKGGKLAKHCYPAHVHNYILSDVLSNRVDMIGSGPTVNDTSSNEEARELIREFNLPQVPISDCISDLTNIETHIIGDVNTLAQAGVDACQKLGYETQIVTTELACDVKTASSLILNYAASNQDTSFKKAFIFSGETTVKVTGTGKGGRNQQIIGESLEALSQLHNVTLISFSSDGSDGPTDAAGGYATDRSYAKANSLNIDVEQLVNNNDCYRLLEQLGQLIITGPTNNNINDICILLCG